MQAFKAKVSGIVQGVGFRYATLKVAKRLGVKGYVKNLFDGSVEVVAEGEAQALAELKRWLAHGPAGAIVKDVQVLEMPYQGRFKDFEIDF